MAKYKPKKLTPTEKKFAQVVVEGNGVKNAADALGMSQHDAEMMAKRLNVQAEIDFQKARFAAREEIKFEYRLGVLKEVVERSLNLPNKNGDFNFSATINAVKELNEMMGDKPPQKIANLNANISAHVGLQEIGDLLEEYVRDH